jgi:hypothetical protein
MSRAMSKFTPGQQFTPGDAPPGFQGQQGHKGTLSPYSVQLRVAKQLGELQKVFPDSLKYEGGEYQVLEKMCIPFKDFCVKYLVTDQVGALSTLLKGKALEYYYKLQEDPTIKSWGFNRLIQKISNKFETHERYQKILGDWSQTTLSREIQQNPGKSKREVLDILLDKLEKMAKILNFKNILHSQVLVACRGYPEFEFALHNCQHMGRNLRTAEKLYKHLIYSKRSYLQDFNSQYLQHGQQDRAKSNWHKAGNIRTTRKMTISTLKTLTLHSCMTANSAAQEDNKTVAMRQSSLAVAKEGITANMDLVVLEDVETSQGTRTSELITTIATRSIMSANRKDVGQATILLQKEGCIC